MQTPIQVLPSAGRSAVCGTLSVSAPFIGAFLFFVLIRVFTDSPLSFVLALSLIPLSPLCGVIFAVVALIRRERFRFFAWIGMVVNLALILFVFVNRNHIIGSMG
jgi:hypothetical protein